MALVHRHLFPGNNNNTEYSVKWGQGLSWKYGTLVDSSMPGGLRGTLIESEWRSLWKPIKGVLLELDGARGVCATDVLLRLRQLLRLRHSLGRVWDKSLQMGLHERVSAF